MLLAIASRGRANQLARLAPHTSVDDHVSSWRPSKLWPLLAAAIMPPMRLRWLTIVFAGVGLLTGCIQPEPTATPAPTPTPTPMPGPTPTPTPTSMPMPGDSSGQTDAPAASADPTLTPTPTPLPTPGQTPAPVSVPGENSSNALAIVLGEVLSFSPSTLGFGPHFYEVQFELGTTYTIDLIVDTLWLPVLTLYRNDLANLENKVGLSLATRIVWTAERSGPYFVAVTGPRGLGSYALTVTEGENLRPPTLTLLPPLAG